MKCTYIRVGYIGSSLLLHPFLILSPGFQDERVKDQCQPVPLRLDWKPPPRPRWQGRESHLKQKVTLLDDPILRSASGYKALDEKSALSIRRKDDANAALPSPQPERKTQERRVTTLDPSIINQGSSRHRGPRDCMHACTEDDGWVVGWWVGDLRQPLASTPTAIESCCHSSGRALTKNI